MRVNIRLTGMGWIQQPGLCFAKAQLLSQWNLRRVWATSGALCLIWWNLKAFALLPGHAFFVFHCLMVGEKNTFFVLFKDSSHLSSLSVLSCKYFPIEQWFINPDPFDAVILCCSALKKAFPSWQILVTLKSLRPWKAPKYKKNPE